MGLGDMLGGLGGGGDVMGMLKEKGVDASAMEGLDADGVTSMLADKGIDLSMLEGLGFSVEDIMAKFKGG